MRRILVTGMSGTGKSTALDELRLRGFEAVDTDVGGFTQWSDEEDGYVWREDRIAELLARPRDTTLYLSGTVSNQGRFYPQLDAVVLLSAPADVLLARIGDRTTNPYGKTADERDLILRHLAGVEPLLRATCTHEIDAAQPLEHVVDELVRIGTCDDRRVAATAVRIRPAEEGDRRPLALLFAAVAEERDGIAAEPPIDVDARAASWQLEGTLVAHAADEIVGALRVVPSPFGFGDVGMMVAAGWRGRGVGSDLVAAAIEWARGRKLHKLTLSVFPHNEAAVGLYRKFGFVEEGRRVRHVRRADGDLWDVIEMGLLL